MVYDDIVIGAGLSALGTVMGLSADRTVLVLAGSGGQYAYYDARQAVPCAYLGPGGLGNDWHGVIPLREHTRAPECGDPGFTDLFSKFYRTPPLGSGMEQQRLFVPWRPIRPTQEFSRLERARGGRLSIIAQRAESFSWKTPHVDVGTVDGSRYRTKRLWIAAGVIHTPSLLDRSLGGGLSRGCVSDHALCYVGLIANHRPPTVTRAASGVLFEGFYDTAGEALYTLRPARFSFRQLDFGIEQRAVFGMPTGSAIAKIARRFSPGLLAEALFNRAGLLPVAKTYSVYAQIEVADAYALGSGTQPLEPRMPLILAATARARGSAPFQDLRASRRHELYIPGIHLHHSIETGALRRHGINEADSPIQVVDASDVASIGPEHHSFRTMLRAYARAQGVSGNRI